MHKIFELKEMELEQLQALASDLGVKGFKKLDKDKLVYAILDAEAIKSAQNPVARPEKKRGRPAKKDIQKPAKPVEEVTVEKDVTTEEQTAAPKEKVRKQKAQNKPSKAEIPVVEEKKAEENAEVQATENQETPKQPKAKRERIKKGHKQTNAEPVNTSAEPVSEQKPQEKLAEVPAEAQTENPVTVSTAGELSAALANGGEIKLSADITVDDRITVLDGTVIKANFGKTTADTVIVFNGEALAE